MNPNHIVDSISFTIEENGESIIYETSATYETISELYKISKDKKSFIELLRERGYSVKKLKPWVHVKF